MARVNPPPCRYLFLLLLPLLLLLSTWKVGARERWDGVVITQADYQGLQAFKRELVDPRGLLSSWNGTGLGACSGAWVGIKCVRGQVIAVQLPFKALGGRISPKVGQLTALRKLSLHDNYLEGRVPSSLALLSSLRGLYLFNNRLSGSVPSSLFSCPLLQSLDLSGNSLSGSIPYRSPSNFTSLLYRLNLSRNRLSGRIPPALLSLSPSLTFLSLHHNNLSGPIPIPDSSGGANSSNLPLKTLKLDHNSLTGTIPTSLSNLRNLQVLTISHNRINGTIPASLSNLTSLVELSLEGNDLTGEIPVGIAGLRNLTSFNVSDNDLHGPVTPVLAERFNSSSFAGNLQLCGYSPAAPCPSPPPSTRPSLPPPPMRQPQESGEAKLSRREIMLIVAGSVLAFLLLLCCVLLCCLMRKRGEEGEGARAAAAEARGEKPGAEGGGAGEAGGKLVHFDGPLVFTADDLLCATAEIMGKSTYGTVYKATLEDGSQVAVKRLREKIAKVQREFESEVNVLGRIRHPNLLPLTAYYLGPKGEKLLVFDYMPKGSLAAFLHARGPETPVDWLTRMKIAMGTARGLQHLHTHENMVHGNLTSSNVLLDENADPKIADFGLSRLMTTAANSNVIATAGALGYRAPELLKLKKASTKTDVYSLGVIILELLTGKSPSEAMNGMDLPQWVASIVKEEWTNEVFDLELMKGVSGATGDELLNTLKLALHCVDPSPSARLEVQQVLQQLEEIKPEVAAAASTSSAVAVGSKEEQGGGTNTNEGQGKEEEA